MNLKQKIAQALKLYQMETKILKEEREMIAQREKLSFDRFLQRCDEAHSESWCLRNPFKGLQEPEAECGREGDSLPVDPCLLNNPD